MSLFTPVSGGMISGSSDADRARLHAGNFLLPPFEMRTGPRPLALVLGLSSSTLRASASASANRSTAAFLHRVSTAFSTSRGGGGSSVSNPCSRYSTCTRTSGSLAMASSSSSSSSSRVVPGRVALLQFPVTEDKDANHETATSYLARASSEGAQLCVLPEIWNGPYATAAFPEYAETLPDIGATLDDGNSDQSPSAKLLMEKAKQYGMWIVGGSVPERVVSPSDDGSKEEIYNTCLCINPQGAIVGKHRKVHLFDIDVPGGITFFESDTLSPGATLTAFDAGEPLGMIGVGIW